MEKKLDATTDLGPRLTRRLFLAGVAGAGAGVLTGCSGFPTIVPRHVLGGPRFVPPSEKVRIAGIGVGIKSKGYHDMTQVLPEQIAVALCDVDSANFETLTSAEKGWPEARTYTNYDEMLEQEHDNIDAVMIATPDHTHAHATLAALRHGKHVFTQKPLCHNLHEVHAVRDAARKAGVATMMGNQGHADVGIRRIREWIDQGAIGNPQEVWYWTNRPIWPQGLVRPEPQPVPATLDWDRWLGPAPERPFNEAYAPFNWRGWCDFGVGALGDIGCHSLDAAFWALDLGQPTRVELETSGCNGETYPAWTIATFDFPAKAGRGPIKVRWYDGDKRPETPKELKDEGRELLPEIGGQMFVGDAGKIMADPYADGARLIPEKAMQAWMKTKPKELYPRAAKNSHYQQWIDAIHGKPDPLAGNFEYAAALTEMVLICNLAVLAGESIEWDAKAGRVTNRPELNRLLTRSYRPGWEV